MDQVTLVILVERLRLWRLFHLRVDRINMLIVLDVESLFRNAEIIIAIDGLFAVSLLADGFM